MQSLGARAEDEAALFLESKNVLILQRNFRVKMGEIDLIAKDGQTLVFVEVRARQAGSSYGSPAESITWRKQKKLTLAAQSFIALHPELTKVHCRFDVVEVKLNKNANSIHWIQDAFLAI